MTRRSAGRTLVVVPAHDEAETIRACVESINAARRSLGRSISGSRVLTVVVADRCSDATERLAAASGVMVVRIDAHSVGVARRVGIAVGLHALGPPRDDDWILCTDADSRVPANWLVESAIARAAGFDLVIGTVRPDFGELPAGYPEWWRSTHPPGRPNGHIHGANLGIRRSVYTDVGGFADLDVDEDIELVGRLRAVGAREKWSDRAEVETSPRLRGRTPGGYAAYIEEQVRRFAAPA